MVGSVSAMSIFRFQQVVVLTQVQVLPCLKGGCSYRAFYAISESNWRMKNHLFQWHI
jgi:hypothetical protein